MLIEEAHVPRMQLSLLLPLEKLTLRRGELPLPLSLTLSMKTDQLARCVSTEARALARAAGCLPPLLAAYHPPITAYTN